MDIITAQQFEALSRLHSLWISDFEKSITPTRGNQMQLAGAIIRGVALSDADLQCASLSSCRLEDCSFVCCRFDSSEFIDTTCVRCGFTDCAFTKADVRGLDASSCTFRRCNFTRADLTDATLAFADCGGSVFDWAWLVRTDLRHAILDGLKIDNARIDHAKMFSSRQCIFTAGHYSSNARVDFSENGDASVLIDWPETVSRLSKAGFRGHNP
jgi:uncharacterized protein YjbI with pentapeptide repeats